MGGGVNTEDKEKASVAPTEAIHAATRLYLPQARFPIMCIVPSQLERRETRKSCHMQN